MGGKVVRKRVFQAGDYGDKGHYPRSKLQGWVDRGCEFSTIPGHVGDWINNIKVPITAIPEAGRARCVEVDSEDYLVVEISYNEFGEEMTGKKAYTNFSLGLTRSGEPDHLALLGYAPPHIKTLDKAGAEFSSGLTQDVQYIEFKEGGNKVTIEELLAQLEGMSVEDKIKLVIGTLDTVDITEAGSALDALQNKIWELWDDEWYAAQLQAKGYTVGKEFSETQLSDLVGVQGFKLTKQDGKPKTREELEAEWRAEFSRTTEKDSFKELFIKNFPPAMKELAEFCVDQAYSEGEYNNLIEFSEGDKQPMREYLKNMIKEGGPFQNLFKEFSGNIDEIKDEDPYEAGARIAKGN